MENKKLIVIFSLIIGVLVLVDILLITYICLDVRYKREVQQMARRPDPVEGSFGGPPKTEEKPIAEFHPGNLLGFRN